MDYSIRDLGADVLLIENLLEPELCTQIIDVAEFCHFESATILLRAIDTDVRNSGILPLDLRNPVQKSTNDLLVKKIGIVQEALYKTYGIRFPHAETCSILRYSPSQQYKRHVDNILLASRFQEVDQGIPTRDVSIVGYLNEDFQGGETFFDRQNLKVKPKMGSAIVFPAYYTHPHQSLPVTHGRKYAWTSWLYH
ncbi:prolyl hydroxylase family protein [Alkalinema pantanalense CENA528]|uniref:prolyl hydroxylase family protein n=1 Tax=Alkalinema pantanalense TaxID=1620705 RepID=UPI003D6F2199